MNLIETPFGVFDLDEPDVETKFATAARDAGNAAVDDLRVLLDAFLREHVTPVARFITSTGNDGSAVLRSFAGLLRSTADALEAL